MTTLDHFTARPALRFDLRNAAMTVTVLALLALGAIALTAPPTQITDNWHGNVSNAAPR